MAKAASDLSPQRKFSLQAAISAVLVCTLYGYPINFKFKQKYQQHGPCFRTVFLFFMTILISNFYLWSVCTFLTPNDQHDYAKLFAINCAGRSANRSGYSLNSSIDRHQAINIKWVFHDYKTNLFRKTWVSKKTTWNTHLTLFSTGGADSTPSLRFFVNNSKTRSTEINLVFFWRLIFTYFESFHSIFSESFFFVALDLKFCHMTLGFSKKLENCEILKSNCQWKSIDFLCCFVEYYDRISNETFLNYLEFFLPGLQNKLRILRTRK